MHCEGFVLQPPSAHAARVYVKLPPRLGGAPDTAGAARTPRKLKLMPENARRNEFVVRVGRDVAAALTLGAPATVPESAAQRGTHGRSCGLAVPPGLVCFLDGTPPSITLPALLRSRAYGNCVLPRGARRGKSSDQERCRLRAAGAAIAGEPLRRDAGATSVPGAAVFFRAQLRFARLSPQSPS
jgi:hypothetical protein